LNNVFELGRNLRIQTSRGSWGAIEDGIKSQAGSLTEKGQSSGRHLVENDTKRKKVGAGIEIFAANLLGRHVGNGAKGSAGAGEMLLVHGGERVYGAAIARRARH
jgi:hypothetical protein